MSLVRNVGVLAVGLLLLGVNLLVLAPMATGAVQEAVDEEFATKPFDDACANDDCSEANEDWATATSSRDYYAWNLTNPEQTLSNPASALFEKVGPVTYDITTTRTIVSHNASAGTLTYVESKSYEQSGGLPGTTRITGLNILFEPQRIGATSLAMQGVFDLTRTGFAVNSMNNDMNITGASILTAADIAEEAAALGVTDESTGWHAIHAQLNSSVAANILYEVTEPSGENISLTSKWGPMLFIKLGAPDCVPDLFEGTAVLGENTTARAQMYGYLETGSDLGLLQTCMQDGTIFLDLLEKWYLNGGFAPEGVQLSPAEYDTNNTLVTPAMITDGVAWDDPSKADSWDDRIETMSGAELDEETAAKLLFAGHMTDEPAGLLATNSEGTSFGLTSFFEMDAVAAMNTFNLTTVQYAEVAAWANGWLLDTTTMPLVLVGGAGTIDATTFALTALGGEEPVNGGYLEKSLNIGGVWGSGAMVAFGANGDVSLTPEQVDDILFGAIGLTGDGCVMFLYGEMTGHTIPLDSMMSPSSMGAEIPWNDTTVATMYGIDENSAAALRYFVRSVMFGDFVPTLLESRFGEEATGYPGATKYVTHTLDEWLFGWRDPMMALLAGDLDDPTLGWQSLETNATYYGSGGVSTGEGTTYKICTGESDTCDKGEILQQDGSSKLDWRTDSTSVATFGRVSAVSLAGTTGGFITGDGDLLNMGDYTVVSLSRAGDGRHYDVPTDTWTATADPAQNSIQAKLVPADSVLDFFPGAVPIYFGGEVTLKVEPTSHLIVSGESTSRFYVDMRSMSEQATNPPTSADLLPVFEIQSSGGASEEQSKEMHSAIVQNQDSGDYWKNFDVWVDYVALILYIGGAVGIFCGVGLISFDKIRSSGDHAKPDLKLEPDITFSADGLLDPKE